jgi:choline dehydrogenase-like flavoprotein
MGDDPATSVVNSDLQSWDHPNLYILGSSVFPTVATANPTLTITALALRAAQQVIKCLG